jgi:hypothetical protein
VYIGYLNAVIIGKPDMADAGTDEQFRRPAAETADSYNQCAAFNKPLLAFDAERLETYLPGIS